MEPTSRRAVLRAAGVMLGGGTLATGTSAAAGSLDDPEHPSAAWYERELRNYATTQEAPAEQASDPDFVAQWQARSTANARSYLERTRREPGWTSHANPSATWGEQAAGNPRLYRDIDARDFYGEVGVRRRVAFHDSQGARLSGHVWTPAERRPNQRFPAVVITPGSVQATEPLYWWFAQTLVAAGYVVLTFDVRGQGRSDAITPEGETGGNSYPAVFATETVDAVDFLRSTPERPYPHNEGRTDVPAPVVAHNPFHEAVDRDRIGVVGHSLGATGVSVVQGRSPWPGAADENPVDAAVAWDNLAAEGDSLAGWSVEPRVPTMGQAADYGLTPTPKERPPNEDAKVGGFADWTAAGVPSYQLVVRGGTHYEWSQIPTFPASSWDAGNAMAEHYSLAWLDRWLKRPEEPGYRDAPDRLLADEEWADHLSFYYRSARAFPDRRGRWHRDDDLRE